MPDRRPALAVAVLLLITAAPSRAEEGPVIADLDTLRFKAPPEKGRTELVEGKQGKAQRFRFDKDARGVFFTSNVRGNPVWDHVEGFSFWVKGFGTDGVAGLEFIDDDDYSVRYDLAFPVRGSDWTKVTVAWDDLVAVLPGPKAKRLGGPGGNPPSKLSALWVGRWWYWGQYPPLDFALDEICLEPRVQRPAAPPRPDGLPLARVHARLKAGKPVTVVTMGDSLTDTRHWANREVSWPSLLAARLKKEYGSEVTVINPAIGGTELRQNLVLIPVWGERAPEPDLVTVFFGGNDWNSGMRGPEFERVCADAVDRVRRATGGKADVLLMTTNPTADRWETTAELADAVRRVARERDAGLADTEAAFHDAGKSDRARLYVRDRTHLSPSGHEVVAETVLQAIEAGGR